MDANQTPQWADQEQLEKRKEDNVLHVLNYVKNVIIGNQDKWLN